MLPWRHAALPVATGLLLLARGRADLNLAELRHSNLCGEGPDVQEARAIRYGDALQSRGESIDLSIQAADGYEPGDSERNANFGEGQQLARISMKPNSRTDLEFKFVKKGTNESRTIGDVAFTFFIPGNGLSVSLFEFDHYCLAESTVLKYSISAHPRSVRFLPKRPQDNAAVPKDPYSLTKEESSLAVTFYFKNVSSFKVHADALKQNASSKRRLEDDHAKKGVLPSSDLVFAGIAGTNPTTNCFSWGSAPSTPGASGGASAPKSDASVAKPQEKLEPFECESHHQFVEIPPHDDSILKAGSLTCVGRGLRAISTQEKCEEAARTLGMVDATVDVSTDDNRPDGCYSLHSQAGTTLWLSRNQANGGNGAETSDIAAGLLRQPICEQLVAQQWPKAKTDWCCENRKLGCNDEVSGTLASTKATTTDSPTTTQRPSSSKHALAAERYNCTADHPKDVTRWSDEHLYWCCSRHSVWCDTSTSTRAAQAATSTTKTTTTKKPTTLSSTSTITTTQATTTTTTLATTRTVTSTSTVVPTTTYTTTVKATQAAEDGRTNPDCNGDPGSWDDAHKTYCCQQQARGCPAYVGPPFTATFTTTTAASSADPSATAATTTTPPYDCLAGRANWRVGWSKSKQKWCCERGLINCKEKSGDKASTPDGIPSSVDFDCGAGLLNWDSLWSVAKQEWCCRMERLGCPKAGTTTPSTKEKTPTSKDYDCQAAAMNWQHAWSEGKKKWCCQTLNVGCPVATTSDPYDCTAGFANWKLGWSRDKKHWCCKQYSRGCEDGSETTSEPFDCHAGTSNWQLGWSAWKKDWCCKHYSLGCVAEKGGTTTKPFDCREDLQYWRTEWSAWKRDWCCRNEDLGCDRVLYPLEAKAEELHSGARLAAQVKRRVPDLLLSRSTVFLLALALVVTAGVLCALSTRIRPLLSASTVRGMTQGVHYTPVGPEADESMAHALVGTN